MCMACFGQGAGGVIGFYSCPCHGGWPIGLYLALGAALAVAGYLITELHPRLGPRRGRPS